VRHRLGDVVRVGGELPVTEIRRGAVRAVANLGDTPSAPVTLSGRAVYDTDDSTVSPERPHAGTVRLAPLQALLLTDR
jgi:hypothetical protein